MLTFVSPILTPLSLSSYMMYQKALLFNDTAIAPRILSARHPRDVKALGRQVKNFNEAIWRRERERIVLKGNILKFTNPVARDEGSGWFVKVTETVSGEEGEKNEEGTRTVTTSYTLREMLLRTGDREIVEASPMDRIWGIGFAAGKAEEVGRERWGLNLLGKALMEVRRLLREEEKKKKKDEAGKGEGEESEA